MTDVIMPQMGESIAEGTVTKWMKNVGDKVQRDEPLFEISTDKVDAEIPAPASGTLKEIRVQPGATVPINTVVGVIAPEGEAVTTVPPRAPAAQPSAPSAPSASSQADGTPGPSPRPSPTTPAAPEPPRPTPAPATPPSPPSEPPRPAPGPVTPPTAPPTTPSPVSSRPTWTSAPAPSAAPSAAAAVPAPQSTAPSASSRADMSVDELRQTRSSPVVRKIAAEHNLDIRDIPGTGIAGRVTKQDILSHIDAKPAEAPAPFPPRPAPTPAPVAAPAPRPPSPPPAVSAPSAAPSPQPSAPTASSRVEVVPMSPIRKKTAEHMVLSKRTSAHVTTVFEIDMTRVDQLRKKYRQQYEERSGVKLTYMPFILKATIDALKALPVLNSSVEGDAIVYRHDINIGIAVALDWGLIVPVIRNADEKNVLGLARAVNDLAERARSKRLKVDEVQGGTFTITNPGVFGSLFGTPIINQPQVAILGIGVIEKRTVVRDDAIAIRTMAYFALSFDHRIVDGSDADRFMAHIKKGLQEFDESAL